LNKRGFTLLEVALFFSITGLLALVAFAGLGPRLRNVRFTDATRTLEASVQQELSNYQFGVNQRESNINCMPGASGPVVSVVTSGPGVEAGRLGDCIINGRLVVLRADKADYYPIISLRKKIIGCSPDTQYGEIFCHGPTVVGFTGSVTERQYNNGASKKAGTADGALIYLQDPNGTESKLFGYNQNNLPTDLTPVHLIDKASDIISLPINFCLTLSGRAAQLQYANNSLRPKVTFEGC
jgi:type II secretory pathway pseudopilin PulG